MMKEFRQVEVRPEGIFLINEKKLSLSSFKAKRTRIESQILTLQDSQRYHETELKKNSRLIQHLENELATFNSPEAIDWQKRREHELALQREQKKREKQEANNRAKQFLHEYIGEEAYAALTKKGNISFEGKDGRMYQITKKGALLRNGKRLCMIRPRDLPLSDFIVSILTTVKEVGRRT